MPSTPPAPTVQIAMSFLHDGRAGLEIMEDWH